MNDKGIVLLKLLKGPYGLLCHLFLGIHFFSRKGMEQAKKLWHWRAKEVEIETFIWSTLWKDITQMGSFDGQNAANLDAEVYHKLPHFDAKEHPTTFFGEQRRFPLHALAKTSFIGQFYIFCLGPTQRDGRLNLRITNAYG